MERFRSRSKREGREARRTHATPGTRAGCSGYPSRSRARWVTRLVLLIALATASLTLTQCRLVADRLTGVSADLFRRKSGCVKACRETLLADRRAEQELHVQNLQSCQGDLDCRAAEQARHAAALAAIEAAYVSCQNNCHDQGSGTLGP